MIYGLQDDLQRLGDEGILLFRVVGGDLAGWLGDLAPRGDLDSTQLLYRLCCISDSAAKVSFYSKNLEIAAKDVTVVHAKLLPLLALVYQAHPDPTPSCTGDHQQSRQQQVGARGTGMPQGGSGEDQSGTVRRDCASRLHDSPAKKARPASALLTRLMTAIVLSPKTLRSLFAETKGPLAPAFAAGVLSLAQERLQLVGSQLARDCCSALEAALESSSVRESPSLGFKSTGEPLEALLQQQRRVWQSAWEGRYSAREQAGHARLLEGYVRAAADRAVRLQPGLAEGLQAILG
jgi:hypothetical protein